MVKLIVDYNSDGKKLDTFITSKYPKLNINVLYKALRKKDIKVNGKRISNNIVINCNDIVEVYIVDNLLNGISKDIDIGVIFEDENILIVNKPRGIEIVSDNNSLTSILKNNFHYSYLEPCHRIDINTIGLVVFAKNEKSLNAIISYFKNNEIEKHYIACCYGISKVKSRTVYPYLFKDSKKSIVYISDEPKKGFIKTKTSYKVIAENKKDKLSLLDVNLHTGKTHQIRVTLAHYSLPILGDRKVWLLWNK